MKLRASHLYRIDQCPGSWSLQEQTPLEDQCNFSSPEAHYGSALHGVAESVLRNPQLHTENPLQDHGFHPESEQGITGKYTVNYYLDYIDKIKGKRVSSEKNRITAYIEEKKQVGLESTVCVAKADYIYVTYHGGDEGIVTIDIFDLKTGSFDYTESGYSQLLFTLYVFLNSMPHLFNWTLQSTLHIVQPNHWDVDKRHLATPVPNATSYPVAMEDFKKWVVRLRKGAKSELNTGAHCTYCPVYLVCPIMKGAVLQVITSYQNPSVTTEWLQAVFMKKKSVENYLKKVGQMLFSKLEKGESMQWVELAPSYGNRKWRDPNQVAEQLKFLGDARYKTELKTPAQMERLAGIENIKDLTYTPSKQRVAVKKSPF